MSAEPNRRTFLRGAAGAIGMGAVGAISSRVMFAEASDLSGRNAEVTVPITVDLENVHPGGGTNQKRWKVRCPNTTIDISGPGNNYHVEWQAGANVQEIMLVAFKGRSPFHEGSGVNKQDIVVLEHGGTAPGTVTPSVASHLKTEAVPSGSEGTYSYTIVVRGKGSAPSRAFAFDPDLDIVG